MGVSAEIEGLPHVDEHAVAVDASPEATWEAIEWVFERSFGEGAAPRVARLLGCEDRNGFHVANSDPPVAGGAAELAYAGRHRFSRYALVFRLDPLDGGRTGLRAETRAEFPGLKGAAYRTAVIGSRGHVLVTRRLLGAIKSRAERAPGAYDPPVPAVLEITPTESVEIISSGPESLEARGIYTGGGKPPPKHLHPFQDEKIEIVSGELRAVVGGEERTLRAGETVEVPRGTVHAMWNESPEPAETVWLTTPPGRTEQWFRAIDAVRREGKVSDDGMPGPLAFGVYLSEYRDVFRLAGPDWLLRPALAALGAVGRARGYRA